MHALDPSGRTEAVYDLEAAGVDDPEAVAVAPSADSTDDPSETSLYVADADGRVLELALAEPPAAALAAEPATLVQTIDTSSFVPPMPDTAGITWLPAAGAFIVSDSEVEEVTGAGYHGVNLWRVRPDGTATGEGTTYPRVLRRADGRRVRPGDRLAPRVGRQRRQNHLRTAGSRRRLRDRRRRPHLLLDVVQHGSGPRRRRLRLGFRRRVSWSTASRPRCNRVNRGPDGTFGTSDDVVTSFDVGGHGARDPEGITYDPVRDTLWIADQRSHAAYELAKTGELVRIVDIRATNSVAISGIEIAPGSARPDRRTMWLTDRGLDNNPVPTENDGRIYELSFDTGSNAPPVVNTVTITTDRARHEHGAHRERDRHRSPTATRSCSATSGARTASPSPGRPRPRSTCR
ncbi:MAG: hypothetical protein KatS3mg010_0446 [Acidimicrobiia bacterium]|nr:MAG: hypothetical protein KatS3mg010_0446 [Acidimicrobiia bacterium]